MYYNASASGAKWIFVMSIIVVIAAFILGNNLRDAQWLNPSIALTLTATQRTQTPNDPLAPIRTEMAANLTKVATSGNDSLIDLYNQVALLRNDVEALKRNNANLSAQDDFQNLSARLETIEDVILENPAKALQVTSLKSQLDNISAELDRISNLYLGILGLIIALAASNIFGALSVRKLKPDSSDTTLADLNEQIRQLNTQIEKLSQQNARKSKSKQE
jgi:hypothetical protein